MREALERVKALAPDLMIDGEMHGDARWWKVFAMSGCRTAR
jgi:phosphotransacetylase